MTHLSFKSIYSSRYSGTLDSIVAFKYPALRCKLRIVHKSTFTDNPPNQPPGKRSRIGDVIILLDGLELNDRLKNFPEDFKFFCE